MSQTWELDRRGLVEACRAVRPALGADLPIHQGTRIEFADGELLIAASNTTMAIQVQASMPRVGAGPAFIVPGMVLSRFLESAEGDVVSVTATGGRFVVETESGRLRLVPFADEFWPRAEPLDRDAVVLSDGDPAQIGRVLFAVASAVHAPSLQGVYLSGHTATATDKQRLAQASLSSEVEAVIVPAAFLRVVLRDFEGAPLSVRVGNRRVGFYTERRAWESQIIRPPYPAIAPLVAQRDGVGHLELDRGVLAKALERLRVFGTAETPVELTAQGDSCRLRAEHPEYGEAAQEIEASGSWTGEIWFNLSHLDDAVAASSSERTVLEIDEAIKPVLVREPSLTQVLMPRVRTSER